MQAMAGESCRSDSTRFDSRPLSESGFARRSPSLYVTLLSVWILVKRPPLVGKNFWKVIMMANSYPRTCLAFPASITLSPLLFCSPHKGHPEQTFHFSSSHKWTGLKGLSTSIPSNLITRLEGRWPKI